MTKEDELEFSNLDVGRMTREILSSVVISKFWYVAELGIAIHNNLRILRKTLSFDLLEIYGQSIELGTYSILFPCALY